MAFERTAMLIDQSAVANGNITINSALPSGNGTPAHTKLFHPKTPFDGYQVGVKVSAGATGQVVLTLQESVDGTTALAGGQSHTITVTGAEGYKVMRYRGRGRASWVIGTAVVTNGPINKLEIGWTHSDGEL